MNINVVLAAIQKQVNQYLLDVDQCFGLPTVTVSIGQVTSGYLDDAWRSQLIAALHDTASAVDTLISQLEDLRITILASGERLDRLAVTVVLNSLKLSDIQYQFDNFVAAVNKKLVQVSVLLTEQGIIGDD
ncbi:hypothetical protein [Lactiplantibacillus plantarum]|uniref:hypothetical protein n=1 Tax=Lactiplantibacillus plantarum TaxID=1590 RepID=UPI002DEC530A|nr:hypothetical protein [Lactiplantibacillus plantarum]